MPLATSPVTLDGLGNFADRDTAADIAVTRLLDADPGAADPGRQPRRVPDIDAARPALRGDERGGAGRRVGPPAGDRSRARPRGILDYPGAGSGPAPFATSTVTAGATSAVLCRAAGPAREPIRSRSSLQPAATGAVIPPVYWTYPITFCTPAPDTSTTVPSTTTTSKAPTTTGAGTPPAIRPRSIPSCPCRRPSTPTTTPIGAAPRAFDQSSGGIRPGM